MTEELRRAGGVGALFGAAWLPVPSAGTSKMSRVETEHEGAYFICESCRDPVDRADPNVVRAFEQRVIRTMGIGNQTIDGLPVLFHRECFSAGDAYRLDQDRSDPD